VRLCAWFNMDLLADYDAADGDDGNSSSPVAGGASFGPGSFRARMTAEPTLLKTTSLALVPSSAHVLGSSSTAMLAYRPDQNLPVDVMYAPSAGPARPDAAKRFIPSSKGTIAGSFESDGIDRTSFEAQFHSYGVRGYAADPSGSGAIIADAGRAAAVAALSSALTSGPSAAGKSSGSAAGVEELAVLHAGSGGGRGRSHAGAGGGGVEIVGAVKRSRLAAGDAGNVDSWKGPWAGFAGEASMKATPLELGTLSEEQKRLRKEQGYNPDRPGRIKDGETGGGPLPPAIGLAGAAAAAPAEEEVAEAGGERKKKRRRKEEGDEGAAAAGAGGSTEESSGAAPAGAGSGSASARADSHGEHGAAAAAPGTAGEGMKPSECRSTWHGKESERVDYQGRSWLEPPKVRLRAATRLHNDRESGRGVLGSRAGRTACGQPCGDRRCCTTRCAVCWQQPKGPATAMRARCCATPAHRLPPSTGLLCLSGVRCLCLRSRPSVLICL
jgi:hypothetical protein